MKQTIKIAIVVLAIFICRTYQANAQVVTDSTRKPMVYQVVDVEPEFEGGKPAYYKFLMNNIRYPARAIDANAQGTVLIETVIDENGMITNASIKKDPVGLGLGEEALRVIKLIPRMIPGSIKGKPVACVYTFTVKFVLH